VANGVAALDLPGFAKFEIEGAGLPPGLIT